MRLYEFADGDLKLREIMETASGGATSAGSIASIAAPVGGIIRRMPSDPNLFGYTKKTKKKRKKHGQ
jgi:hypothetical protein